MSYLVAWLSRDPLASFGIGILGLATCLALLALLSFDARTVVKTTACFLLGAVALVLMAIAVYGVVIYFLGLEVTEKALTRLGQRCINKSPARQSGRAA